MLSIGRGRFESNVRRRCSFFGQNMQVELIIPLLPIVGALAAGIISLLPGAATVLYDNPANVEFVAELLLHAAFYGSALTIFLFGLFGVSSTLPVLKASFTTIWFVSALAVSWLFSLRAHQLSKHKAGPI